MAEHPDGLVIFAYDGSELAKLAIDEAGRQLQPGLAAVALTVWQPFDVGFAPAAGIRIDAQQVQEIKALAERTAAEGASLADAAGFRAQSAAVEGAPIWKAIVDVADERDASLIVLGSHGRRGFSGMVLGSVAGAVAAHSERSVLITHRRS